MPPKSGKKGKKKEEFSLGEREVIKVTLFLK